MDFADKVLRDVSALGAALTLTLSQGERGPFGAGGNLGLSRHGLPPLPEGEGWGEGERAGTDCPEVDSCSYGDAAPLWLWLWLWLWL